MGKVHIFEKAAKLYKIFPLLLTKVHTVKSKVKISDNVVAFSEYVNFNVIVVPLNHYGLLDLTYLFIIIASLLIAPLILLQTFLRRFFFYL